MSENQANSHTSGLDLGAYTPFPLAPHVTKTIRFREEYLLLVKRHASEISEGERRAVSQSEVIDMALTRFFAAANKASDSQIDLFKDSERAV